MAKGASTGFTGMALLRGVVAALLAAVLAFAGFCAWGCPGKPITIRHGSTITCIRA